MNAQSQSLPFVENYLPAMMNKASHLISAEFHDVALAHGFSVTEWRVLACLHGGNGYNIGDLSQAALTKQPTLTRLLARMEARGEVVRKDSPEDRRVTLVRLTAKGTRVANKLVALAREHEERVLAELGFQSASDLKRVLRQLVELHGQSAQGMLGIDGED